MSAVVEFKVPDVPGRVLEFVPIYDSPSEIATIII